MRTVSNAFGICTALKMLRCSTLAVALVCASSNASALELNQANEAELDSLKGMGPSFTAKVLAARTQAPFTTWQDFIARVAGMGPAKARSFSAQGLTVEGQSWEPSEAKASSRQ
jgi:competence protein ComEA